MSVERPPVVPAPLLRALSPRAALDESLTILVLTVSSDGHPHQAMLSCGEVIAPDEGRLVLAVWPRSTAARNLAARPRATLTAVIEGTSWSVSVAVAPSADVTTPLGGTLRTFAAEVVKVTSDRAPYAVLESGVTFRLVDAESTRRRWQEVRTALAGGVP
jgi:hypothetical protein